MGLRMSSAGPASYGYYRGNPMARGTGSGMGQAMNGAGVFAQGQGSATTSSQWSPTIVYMLVLTIAEMAIFAYLSRKV